VGRDPAAFRAALDTMSAGDAVTIFTPDDTHFEIAMAAVERGCHVLAAKPIVQTLADHLALIEAAEAKGVLVAMEVHKRWDPIYADARDRIRGLGDFSFFSSYMSQPKSQLDTFRAWAGKSSDISYYLNAHHVDFNVWAVSRFARPLSVHASAATGVAKGIGIPAEDTITLTVDWRNIASGNRATAVYTSSWIAPKSDVHSQQRFFYMGHKGEVNVDQAHRGYTLATDVTGYAAANPLFMKYTPDADGYFAGQTGYGYRSFEAFVDAAAAIRAADATARDFEGKLATVQETALVTAILEAGRRSLDDGGSIIGIDYDDVGRPAGLSNR
jgi:D-galacturonate reductase